VRIFRNRIRGGTWNGITLGSLEVPDVDDSDTPDLPDTDDHCAQCKPIDLGVPATPAVPGATPTRFASAGDLYDIEIGDNQITDMGINGIGVVRFFDLAADGDLVGVHGLHITDNIITRCMRLATGEVDASMTRMVGYGGIALAKVSDLRILRNEIMGNGPTDRLPICGVFAIIVQGLQLDDNRIFDNGHSSGDDAGAIQRGVRGGVHLWLVLPQIEQAVGGKYQSSFLALRSANNGLSTGNVRDNLIVAPLGRALTFFALGPVVIARNRLVSQGVTGQSLDLIAATVMVGDLGISNEWTMGLFAALVVMIGGGDKLPDNFDTCAFAKGYGVIRSLRPLALWSPISSLWATGKLSFTENQVSLDVVDEVEFGLTASSVLVFSLDDVGFTDNQLEVSSTHVFALVDALVLGGSVRIADNRFSETWYRSFFSAITFGGMNTTTDNQSTHCIRASSLFPNMLVFRDNLALVEVFCPNECKQG
jgi:hypothetical protein